MRREEIRAMTGSELRDKLDEKRQELYKLRMAWAGNSLDNPNEVRKVRKDIARIQTILRELELATEVVKGEGE
ncbi:MAG: 50S ribosomal protein L29 [Anaerolineae bacterium]|nr:50S ribosomal protein L29 [Anaerolineae bacterium]